MKLLVLSVALLSSTMQQSDVQGQARTFLETFARDPIATKNFAVEGALVSIGEIGGPFEEYVEILASARPNWLNACELNKITNVRNPTADELKDGPPEYKGGKISFWEGAYSCVQKDGLKFEIKFSLAMKDEHVAGIHLDRVR